MRNGGWRSRSLDPMRTDSHRAAAPCRFGFWVPLMSWGVKCFLGEVLWAAHWTGLLGLLAQSTEWWDAIPTSLCAVRAQDPAISGGLLLGRFCGWAPLPWCWWFSAGASRRPRLAVVLLAEKHHTDFVRCWMFDGTPTS